MRTPKLHSAAVIAALVGRSAAAAADAPPPPPERPPPEPPAGPPPPVAPPPGAAANEPGPPPVPGAFPGERRFARRPHVGPGGAVPMHFEPVEPPTSLLILTHETPVAQYGYYRHGWWGWHHSIVRSYTPVCDGPCTERFVPGVYDLALAKDGHVAVPDRPVVIRGPSIVRGQYVDKSGLRVGGVVLAVGGIIGGTVMMIAAVHRDYRCSADYCYYESDVNGPLLAGGIVLAIGAGIAGSIMAWQRDEARFSVLPMRVGSLFPQHELSVAEALPQGAMFRLKF